MGLVGLPLAVLGDVIVDGAQRKGGYHAELMIYDDTVGEADFRKLHILGVLDETAEEVFAGQPRRCLGRYSYIIRFDRHLLEVGVVAAVCIWHERARLAYGAAEQLGERILVEQVDGIVDGHGGVCIHLGHGGGKLHQRLLGLQRSEARDGCHAAVGFHMGGEVVEYYVGKRTLHAIGIVGGEVKLEEGASAAAQQQLDTLVAGRAHRLEVAHDDVDPLDRLADAHPQPGVEAACAATALYLSPAYGQGHRGRQHVFGMALAAGLEECGHACRQLAAGGGEGRVDARQALLERGQLAHHLGVAFLYLYEDILQGLVAEVYAALAVGQAIHQPCERLVDTALERFLLAVEGGGRLHGAVVDKVARLGLGGVGAVDVLEHIWRGGRHEVVDDIVFALILAYMAGVKPLVGDDGRVVASAVEHRVDQLYAGLAGINGCEPRAVEDYLGASHARNPCLLVADVHGTVGDELAHIVAHRGDRHAQLAHRGDDCQRYHLADGVDVAEAVVVAVAVVYGVEGGEGALGIAVGAVKPTYLDRLGACVEVGEHVEVVERAQAVGPYAGGRRSGHHLAEYVGQHGISRNLHLGEKTPDEVGHVEKRARAGAAAQREYHVHLGVGAEQVVAAVVDYAGIVDLGELAVDKGADRILVDRHGKAAVAAHLAGALAQLVEAAHVAGRHPAKEVGRHIALEDGARLLDTDGQLLRFVERDDCAVFGGDAFADEARQVGIDAYEAYHGRYLAVGFIKHLFGIEHRCDAGAAESDYECASESCHGECQDMSMVNF